MTLPLASYISDPDGGPFTLSGTYTFNGGGSLTLPSGTLFTFPTGTTLEVTSTQTDVGSYTITLYITDPGGKVSPATSFTLQIIETNPKIVSTPPNRSMPHNSASIIDLASYFTDDDQDPLTMYAS